MFEELIGYSAGFLTLVTMIPQAIKSYKTKKVEDVSFSMVLIFFLGASLWTWYGLIIKDMPVFLMDLIAAIISLIEILLILKYKK